MPGMYYDELDGKRRRSNFPNLRNIRNLIIQVFEGGSFDPVLKAQARLSPESKAIGGRDDAYTWELNTDVRGNFLVRIKMPQLFKTKKVCEAWENTAFIEKDQLVFARDDLDIKSKMRRKFNPETCLEIDFDDSQQPVGSGTLQIAGPSQMIWTVINTSSSHSPAMQKAIKLELATNFKKQQKMDLTRRTVWHTLNIQSEYETD